LNIRSFYLGDSSPFQRWICKAGEDRAMRCYGRSDQPIGCIYCRYLRAI